MRTLGPERVTSGELSMRWIKSEGLRPKSERNPKSEARTRRATSRTFFGFRASAFFRISAFGFGLTAPCYWATILTVPAFGS
jgi:hypothetical protein